MYEEALAVLEKITEIDPYHSNSWFRKGEVLEALNRSDEALKCYDKVIDIEANPFDAWENKGTLLRLKIKKRLAKIKPDQLQEILDELIDLFDNAELCYDKAMESRPNDAHCRFKRAVLFIERYLIDDQNMEYYLKKGLDELKIAVEVEPTLKETTKKDIAFEFIRGNPEFQRIID